MLKKHIPFKLKNEIKYNSLIGICYEFFRFYVIIINIIQLY